VLAELIWAVAGQDHTEAVRTRVAEPLGLDGFSLGDADAPNVADVVLTGEPATPDELEGALGSREVDLGEVTDEALVGLNDPGARAVGLPGGGGVATAADLTAFYQALLDDRLGLWDPEVLRDVTTHVRNTFPDPMLGTPANRTRGLILAGDDGRSNIRGMGRTVSPCPCSECRGLRGREYLGPHAAEDRDRAHERQGRRHLDLARRGRP
jgi:CubicO group peptidase (beta-lactamase class C family)